MFLPPNKNLLDWNLQIFLPVWPYSYIKETQMNKTVFKPDDCNLTEAWSLKQEALTAWCWVEDQSEGTIMEGLFPLKKQLGRKTNFVLGDQPRVLKVLL